MTVHCWLR